MRFACVVFLAVGACSTPSTPPPMPTAIIDARPDLVGFATTLDGTGSTGVGGAALSFAWHFAAVPAGSQVDDSSLTSPGDPSVQFEPDLGGDYVLELIVSDADGRFSKATATVTVPTVPIFYYEGQGHDGGMSQLGVAVMRSDGTGRRLINCPLVTKNALAGLRFAGLYGMRTWEPPAGPVRNVFLEIVPDDDGGVSDFRLWAADENSGCTTQPAVRIDSTGFFNDHEHFWPRFSPDGSRVLYVDKPQDMAAYTYRLVTVGFDDKALFVIRSGMPRLSNTPPVWVDGEHIAWAENLSTTSTPHLVVYVASDRNAAGDSATAPGDRTVLLDCDGPGGQTGIPVLKVINQLEIVNGIIYLAGEAWTSASVMPAMEIFRMVPGYCSTDIALASEPPGGQSWDFTISPDARTIAFASTRSTPVPDGGAQDGSRDIYTVPIDGSSPPRLFAGAPLIDDVGPRFIAGGRQLVWTQVNEKPLAGGGVMIANADGSHVHQLYAEGNGISVIAGSNLGTSCDYVGAGAPLLTLAALAAIGLALAVRAGRRSSSARRRDRRTPTDT